MKAPKKPIKKSTAKKSADGKSKVAGKATDQKQVKKSFDEDDDFDMPLDDLDSFDNFDFDEDDDNY